MKFHFNRRSRRLYIGLIIAALVMAAFIDRANYEFKTGAAARKRLESYTWQRTEHEIRLIDDPADAFLTRRAMIQNAEEYIDLATFLWRDDESSRIIFDDLIRACERGVRVRILGDGIFFLRKLGRVKAMAQAHTNLELRVFNPLGNRLASMDIKSIDDLGWSFDNMNHRFHIKLLTTDHAQTLTGGRNIGDRYFGFSDDYNFIDMDVLIRGAAAEQADRIFETFWSHHNTRRVLSLQDVADAVPEPKSAPDPVPGRYTKGSAGSEWHSIERMALWADQPDAIDNVSGYQPDLLADRLADLIGIVENELLVSTPYLILSERSRTLLSRLREKNSRLRLHFISNSLAAADNLQTYAAFQSQLKTMISDYRLLIHLKKPHSLRDWSGLQGDSISSLHAKVWVVDERWSAIGSFNWDPRSEIFNAEVMAIFDDTNLARRLRRRLQPLTRPENAWVVAQRKLPIGLEQLDHLADLSKQVIDELVGIQIWSIRNTACFEPIGGKIYSPYEEGFYDHYRPVGSFPEVSPMDKKRIYSALYQPITGLTKPAL